MSNLPDLEAWAIFARVAETRSFARAAELLGISQPTVSKAIGRLEQRLGTALMYRNSRSFSLTPAGELLKDRAIRLLNHAEAIEHDASDHATTTKGTVRINVPMSFGLQFIVPLLPGFLERYPEVDVDISLSDQLIDVISSGFDVTVRIADLGNALLRSRRLCAVRRPLVASPAYLERHGTPEHPRDLEHHNCLLYTNTPTPNVWHLHHASLGEYQVAVSGRLTSNNACAFMPMLLEDRGISVQPEFLVLDELQSGALVRVLPDWHMPLIHMNLVTPPGLTRPARVTALLDYLSEHVPKALGVLPLTDS